MRNSLVAKFILHGPILELETKIAVIAAALTENSYYEEVTRILETGLSLEEKDYIVILVISNCAKDFTEQLKKYNFYDLANSTTSLTRIFIHKLETSRILSHKFFDRLQDEGHVPVKVNIVGCRNFGSFGHGKA